MQNEEHILELLSESLKKQDVTNDELKKLNKKVEPLEKQQAKTNLAVNKLELSIMKLAEEFTKFTNFEERLQRIEAKIFP